MIKIGITGGIGTGKSVVSQLLRVMGYPVFDTDLEAKRLMNDSSELRSQLILAFGPQAFENGVLNRPYLASVIFNDPDALDKMNGIVHPMVRCEFHKWAHARNTPVVFLESAILFESGLHESLDQVWTVSSPMDLRIERVMKRDSVPADRVEERIRSQMSQEEKEKRASRVILNDEKNALLPQVLSALASLQ